MKIIAIEKDPPGVKDEDFTPELLQAEALRAWELYQAGIIRELYFRQDEAMAILILECGNVEEASQVVETLPLVKAGLIGFEYIPLAAYPGFGRLFSGA